MSTGAERLNRREQNRSSLHFHWRRKPEQKGTEQNRTEAAAISTGAERLNRREQNRSSFSMSKGTESLNRREQKQLSLCPRAQKA
jgi:hypothetical protein